MPCKRAGTKPAPRQTNAQAEINDPQPRLRGGSKEDFSRSARPDGIEYRVKRSGQSGQMSGAHGAPPDGAERKDERPHIE